MKIEKLKCTGKKIKTTILYILLTVQMVLMNQIPVLASGKKGAGGLKDTKLYTGTLLLIKDAQVVALGIEAALIVFLLIKEGIKMQAAEQEEKPKYKKSMISIAIIGVIIISITALVPAVLSYYQ